jgi:hypothetical protein
LYLDIEVFRILRCGIDARAGEVSTKP